MFPGRRGNREAPTAGWCQPEPPKLQTEAQKPLWAARYGSKWQKDRVPSPCPLSLLQRRYHRDSCAFLPKLYQKPLCRQPVPKSKSSPKDPPSLSTETFPRFSLSVLTMALPCRGQRLHHCHSVTRRQNLSNDHP